MSCPLVSVIIPNFNRQAELQRAVDSVLAQDYEDLEIIVVDDASTMDIRLSLPSSAQDQLRWITLPRNRGGASARNAGIAAARGEVVAFLDSDDVWTSDKLTRQVACYLADGRPQACVYYSQVVLDRGFEHLTLPQRPLGSDESVGDYLFPWRGNLIHTSTLFMSRELAAAVRFTDDLRIHQDVDFCLRLRQAGAEFRFHPEPLSRWHAEERQDRMSYRPKFLLSLDWLETSGELMSFAVRRKFATQLASRMPAQFWRNPGVVLRGLWRCWRSGYISSRYGLRLVTQFVVPQRLSDNLARALKATPARNSF